MARREPSTIAPRQFAMRLGKSRGACWYFATLPNAGKQSGLSVRVRSGFDYLSKVRKTMRFSCSTLRATLRAGMPEPSALRATRQQRLSENIFLSFTLERPSRHVGLNENWKWPQQTDDSRTKVGDCAKMAQASGPTLSSPRCATRTEALRDSPRLPATSPNECKRKPSYVKAKVAFGVSSRRQKTGSSFSTTAHEKSRRRIRL